MHDAIVAEGMEELDRTSSALFWSGLAAGLTMGFSLIAQGLLRAHLPDEDWARLIVKLGYPVGFLFVVLGRQQLFTENTLTPILPVLEHRRLSMLANVGRLWGIVLAANLLGALAISWAFSETGALDPGIRSQFAQIGREAVRHGPLTILWRAVFAGWLIALMVWLMPFAETGRIAVIIIVTYIVGLGGFSHVIAGSIDVFTLAWAGERGWLEVLGGYTLPALAGNIVGGVTLVAALNHAQVATPRL